MNLLLGRVDCVIRGQFFTAFRFNACPYWCLFATLTNTFEFAVSRKLIKKFHVNSARDTSKSFQAKR